MPVYFKSDNLLKITQEDDSDISENELYLEDPDMLFDRLPQPFRLINKIVNKICNDAWCNIIELNEIRKASQQKRYIQSISAIDQLKVTGTVQCMCTIEMSHVLMGMKEGLAVWNIEEGKQEVLDTWSGEGMNVTSMSAYRLADNTSLVITVNEDGSARIVAVILGRIYFVKEFQGSKEGEKPAQVTNASLDSHCGIITLSFAQIGGEEHWVEVHKVNKEAWLKEIGAVGKAYQEYLRAQSTLAGDEAAAPEPPPSETPAVLDRNAIRVSLTTIVMKMKFPDAAASPGSANISQLFKQVDGLGSCIGMGLNHGITKNVLDARMMTSKLGNAVLLEEQSYLMRIANVRYITSVGSLLPGVWSSDASPGKESQMILLWWSQSQHLLMYGLNKPPLKDLWVKPDAVRSFSCYISACELSPSNSLIGIGLQNGIFILIEIGSGLTRFVKKMSEHAIRSVYFLDSQGSDDLQCINVTDDKHTSYCVSFNSAITNDNVATSIIESDASSDAVVIIHQSYNLTLSVYREGPLILRDMLSGISLVRLDLPVDTTVSCPWSPIFASSAGQFLCLQGLLSDGGNEPKCQSVTLLYNIGLNQFQCEKASESIKEADAKPFIVNMADAYMKKRLENHDDRQQRLQKCLADLSSYFQAGITVS